MPLVFRNDDCKVTSREEVIAAYRLLLGREPESEAVVTHYATEVADLRALRALFINFGGVSGFARKVADAAPAAARVQRPGDGSRTDGLP